MWSWHLREIKATKHHINLESGTQPIRSIPRHQVPTRRQIVEEEIRLQLGSGLIEATSAEWALQIVLVP